MTEREIGRMEETMSIGSLMITLQDELQSLAETLNDGEYETIITHVVLPAVRAALTREPQPSGAGWQTGKPLREGEPCSHPGCLSHVSHPCEGCGRIAGRRVPSGAGEGLDDQEFYRWWIKYREPHPEPKTVAKAAWFAALARSSGAGEGLEALVAAWRKDAKALLAQDSREQNIAGAQMQVDADELEAVLHHSTPSAGELPSASLEELDKRVRALPSIKDEHGDECVGREAVLAQIKAVLGGGELGSKGQVAELRRLREALYACIVELEYVQSVENCNSGLCASAKGKDLIEQGMRLLGVKDLSAEALASSNPTAPAEKEGGE